MKYFLSFAKIFGFLVVGAVAFSQTITNQSDLQFPASEADSAEYTILASTVETSENASFLISGTPSTAYSISLPRSASMENTQGGGKIRVTNFHSYPAEGANGLLDASGNQWLYVGATRAKLSKNQTPGLYVISFTVTVVY